MNKHTLWNNEKYCSSCRQMLSFEHFYKKSTKYNGLRPYGWCKECTKLKTASNRRQYGQRYIEKTRQQKIKWRLKNKTKHKYQCLKHEAKRRNIEISIDFESFKQLVESNCYYCNTTLAPLTGGCLDRIDNFKGYSLNNVLPCCGRCNKTRHDGWTVEETKVMIDAVIEFKNKQ